MIFRNFCLGFITGYLAFGWDSPSNLVLSAAVPFVWCVSQKRIDAAAYIFGYYMAAARGIPYGSMVFFAYPSLLNGFVMLTAASMALTTVWSAFFVKEKTFLALLVNLTIVCIFITIPPVGIVSWASPLLSAGFIFPTTGFTGIAAFLTLTSAAAVWHDRTKRKKTSASILISFIIFTFFFAPDTPNAPKDWLAINTHFGRIASGSGSGSIRPFKEIYPQIEASGEKYILLPETFIGNLSPDTYGRLQPFLREIYKKHQTLILGCEVYSASGKYDNSLLFFSKRGIKKYRQRIPVPVSMWKLSYTSGANPYPWERGLIRIDGKNAVCLLCYEQFLAWPMLRAMIGNPRPEILIAAANQWWCRSTSIPNIQRQSAVSWAMLFNLEYISATNL